MLESLLTKALKLDAPYAQELCRALEQLQGSRINAKRREVLQELSDALDSGRRRRIQQATDTFHETFENVTTNGKEEGKGGIKDCPDEEASMEQPSKDRALDPTYLRAFEKKYGKTLEDMNPEDTKNRTSFTLGKTEYSETPNALFLRIARKVFGTQKLIKAQKFLIHIRDGKSQKEAKELVENVGKEVKDRALDPTYLRAFEEASGKTLEDMDPRNSKNLVTFTLGKTEYSDTPGALFLRIARKVFGTQKLIKAQKFLIHIRDGKSQKEAKELVENEVIDRALDPSYLLAFEKKCGKTLENMKIDEKEKRVTFMVGKTEYSDTPGALFQRIAQKVFGTKIAVKARQFLIHIRDGKSQKEAKELVENEVIDRALDPTYLLAFEKARGKALENMVIHDSDNRVTFMIGKTECSETPHALFQRIAQKVFGTTEIAKAKQFLIQIRDGKSQKEAKELVENVGKEVKDRALDPTYLRAFEEASGKTLENMDIEDYKIKRVTFTVGKTEYSETPGALFSRIAQKVFGTSEAAKAKQFLIHIRDGKSVEEAMGLVENEVIDRALNSIYLLAFEKARGKALENMDVHDSDNRVTFMVGKTEYSETPHALFQRIALKVFGTSEIAKAKQFLIHIRGGKNEEEAKRLVELGEDGVAELENEELAALGIEELIAAFQDSPNKLYIILSLYHPELTEVEKDRLIVRNFRNLSSKANLTKEEQYLRNPVELPPVTITKKIPQRTKGNTVILEGEASDAEYVHIGSRYSRRLHLKGDKKQFRVSIPLKIGESNDIRVMSLRKMEKKNKNDEDQWVRSKQLCLTVKQTGELDDIDELVRLIGDMRGNLLQEIQEEPRKTRVLVEQMEHVLIKKFSRSFKEGEQYVQALKKKHKNRVIQKVLNAVLRNFKEVNATEYANVNPKRPLYFFQKYCVKLIRDKIARGEPGFILANAPGTGKTTIVLTALSEEQMCIVCPNGMVSAWDEEAHECLINPDLLVLQGMDMPKRKDLLGKNAEKHRVSNRESLRKLEDEELFGLLSGPEFVKVADEGHSLSYLQSLQTRGMQKLDGKFLLVVTASPASNPEMMRRLLTHFYPGDKRFSSAKAFNAAFPSDDPVALRELRLLLQKHMVRFTEDDVMETMDPKIPAYKQKDKLPVKEHVDPFTELGSFIMLKEQAQSIYELFLNYPAWMQKYGLNFPTKKDQVAKMDRLYNADNQLTKEHAIRQIIDHPEYIGVKNRDPKSEKVKEIIAECDKEGRPATVFSTYNALTRKFHGLLNDRNPALFTGITSKLKYKREGDRPDGKPLRFKHAKRKAKGKPAWELDPETGGLIEDSDGSRILALDFERLRFQKMEECTALLATYAAGSEGNTFTKGKALIGDQEANYRQKYQAHGRIRRIDHEHLTHSILKYYSLVSMYPEEFLEEKKKVWVVKQEDGTYEEYKSKTRAKAAAVELGTKAHTAYDTFFAQGTWDQVRFANLEIQREIFQLLHEGFGDESLLKLDQIKFAPFNGDGEEAL